MRLLRVALVCLPSLMFFGCPEPVTDPCETVNCGAGRCIPNNGQAACLCDTTYVAQGLTCVPATSADACANNPCASSGKTCSTFNGQAICSCPSGYVDSASGCVKQNPCNPDPCTAANQSCQAVSGAAVCVCDPGYTPVGTGCSTDPVYDCNRQHSGGAADDQYEPNECPTVSTPYDLTGGAQTHTLAPAGDEDWIRISPVEGHVIGVDFSGSSFPLYVDVYAADGVTPIASDHRGVNTPSFRFLALSNDLHYVRVRALRANDTGSYTLTVTDTGPDDFTNDSSTALSIAPGGTFSGEVQYTGDVDVVRVPVQATHTYRLQLATTTATAAGIVVEVVGADGSTVRKTMDKVVSANQWHTVRPTADGEILLRAKAESVGTVGVFSLSITDYGVDDHGDLVIDATAITPSSSGQSAMFETRPTGAALDNDVFTFAAQAGHIYAFTCTSGSSNYYSCVTFIRDASGALLASLSGGSSSTKTVSYEALSSGTLNITISPYSSSTSYVGPVSYKLEDLGADDYGDNLANATPFGVGPRTGRIESAGDLDYFSLSTTAGHIFQVGCTPDTTLTYCSLRVLDASGVLVTSSSTSGTLSFEAAATGTYYVEVKAYYSTYLGSYTLSVTDVGTDDHGDTAATATALTLGTAKGGNIELGGDVDFFSISATANSIYSIQCSSSSTYLCYMTVRDPGGATLTTTSYGTSVSTGFRALVTGTYTVSVRGYYSTDVGSYSITATNTGADDHSDTATGATALTLGATATNGNIQFAADKDVFSFSATTGRIYRASCNTSASYLCVLSVKNASGTSVATSSYGLSTSAVFEAATTGTFTVEVTAYSSSYTGVYTIAVADEGTDDHGDTTTTATPITTSTTATSAKLELSGDYDVFSFTGTAGNIYRFSCTTTATYLCYMTARNSAGTSIVYTSYGTATNVAFVAPTTGTYFVEVRAYSSSYTGSYTYQLTDEGTEDHGNTTTTATAISPSSTATNAKLEVSSDIDVFGFTGTAGNIYKFSCTTSASYLCVLTAKNSAGTTLTSSSYGTATSVVFTAPTTGTYYVEVRAYSSSYTGAYAFQLTDLGVDDHGDTAAASTTVVTVPGTATGNIQHATDKDVVKFDATAGRLYKFACTGSDVYGCRMILRDAVGTSQGTSTYGTAVNYYVRPTSAGTFSVELSNYNAATGSWSLTISETTDDHGDTPANATNLTLGVATSGQLEVAADYDYFAVNLNANQAYTFAIGSSPTIYAWYRIENAAGTVVSTENYTPASRSYTPTVAGTYYVRVRPYSASYLGAYTITVQ